MKNKTIWKEIELKEILETLTGFAFKSKLFNTENQGFQLIRIRDLSRGFSKTYYSGDFDNKYLANKGDFLIGMDGEFKIHEWKTEKSLLNQRVCKLVPNKNKVIPKYLLYLLSQKLKEIEDKTSFVTVKHISAKQIEEIKVPLPFTPERKPDLEKQKQIVSILEKVEKLKEKRKEAGEVLDEFLKGVFYEMFLKGDKFEEVKLKEIGKIVSGSTPKTNIEKYWSGEINWIAPAELICEYNYFYRNTRKKITLEGLKSCSAELFPKGTVMLSSRAPIGKVAIAGVEMCSNQGFKNIIPSEKINSVYLYFWLLLKKKFLNSIGRGATFKEISKRQVESIKIPLPPLSLQERFASIVEHVEKLKEKQKASKKEIDDLFNVLMQKAFKGELV